MERKEPGVMERRDRGFELSDRAEGGE